MPYSSMTDQRTRLEATADERVALISGGARGIGRQVAKHLAQKRWKVAICYRKSAAAARELGDQCDRGGEIFALQCDVSDPEDAERFVETVQRRWGRIDALLNCAGPYHRVFLLDETPAGWREMFDNNLHPVFYLSRAVAAQMKRQRWGRIINFAVANAERPAAPPNVTAYHIAKAGVVALTRTLAQLLAPDGITVNSISPGFIDSGGLPTSELDRNRSQIPAGEVGTVDDVLSAVLYLLSDDAAYVNGTNIHVSGAWGL